jgi:hypothetical protein
MGTMETTIVLGKVYTRLGGSDYKQVEWGQTPLPPCQHHYIVGGAVCTKPGEFDAKTKAGPWADLCSHHVTKDAVQGVNLGFHRVRLL